MTAELLVVGVSHRTAPLELRERLAVRADRLPQELQRILHTRCMSESVLLSTCNRIEIYSAASDPGAASHAARAYLDAQSTPGDQLAECLYEHRSTDAVRHAFRVTSSLDSMVLGEPQILGQVKKAYEAASSAGAVGTLLGRCFNRAFAVAKRVRNETGVARGSVSVSSIAVELATKIFADLRSRRVLLIGAGKMGETAARKLASRGARVLVVNRSPERARELAHSCGGTARDYETLAQDLVQADVVITSTGSERFILSEDQLRDVMRARRHRPLFLIDIAVPRDVDPRVGELDEIFLYDIDDLQHVADENLAARRREADNAEAIVEDETEQFERWRRSLSLTPTVVALRQRFHDVVRAELERTTPQLGQLGPEQRGALDKMCNSIVNKLLHSPLTELRTGADEPDHEQLLAAVQRLFDLEPEMESGEPNPASQTEQTTANPDWVGDDTRLAPATGGRRRSRS